MATMNSVVPYGRQIAFVVRFSEARIVNFYTALQKLLAKFRCVDAYFLWKKQRFYVNFMGDGFFERKESWIGLQKLAITFFLVKSYSSGETLMYTYYSPYNVNRDIIFFPFNKYTNRFIYWDCAASVRTSGGYFRVFSVADTTLTWVRERSEVIANSGGSVLTLADETTGAIFPVKLAPDGLPMPPVSNIVFPIRLQAMSFIPLKDKIGTAKVEYESKFDNFDIKALKVADKPFDNELDLETVSTRPLDPLAPRRSRLDYGNPSNTPFNRFSEYLWQSSAMQNEKFFGRQFQRNPTQQLAMSMGEYVRFPKETGDSTTIFHVTQNQYRLSPVNFTATQNFGASYFFCQDFRTIICTAPLRTYEVNKIRQDFGPKDVSFPVTPLNYIREYTCRNPVSSTFFPEIIVSISPREIRLDFNSALISSRDIRTPMMFFMSSRVLLDYALRVEARFKGDTNIYEYGDGNLQRRFIYMLPAFVDAEWERVTVFCSNGGAVLDESDFIRSALSLVYNVAETGNLPNRERIQCPPAIGRWTTPGFDYADDRVRQYSPYLRNVITGGTPPISIWAITTEDAGLGDRAPILSAVELTADYQDILPEDIIDGREITITWVVCFTDIRSYLIARSVLTTTNPTQYFLSELDVVQPPEPPPQIFAKRLLTLTDIDYIQSYQDAFVGNEIAAFLEDATSAITAPLNTAFTLPAYLNATPVATGFGETPVIVYIAGRYPFINPGINNVIAFCGSKFRILPQQPDAIYRKIFVNSNQTIMAKISDGAMGVRNTFDYFTRNIYDFSRPNRFLQCFYHNPASGATVEDYSQLRLAFRDEYATQDTIMTVQVRNPYFIYQYNNDPGMSIYNFVIELRPQGLFTTKDSMVIAGDGTDITADVTSVRLQIYRKDQGTMNQTEVDYIKDNIKDNFFLMRFDAGQPQVGQQDFVQSHKTLTLVLPAGKDLILFSPFIENINPRRIIYVLISGLEQGITQIAARLDSQPKVVFDHTAWPLGERLWQVLILNNTFEECLEFEQYKNSLDPNERFVSNQFGAEDNVVQINVKDYPKRNQITGYLIEDAQYPIYESAYRSDKGLRYLISKFITKIEKPNVIVEVKDAILNATKKNQILAFSKAGLVPYTMIVRGQPMREGIRMFREAFSMLNYKSVENIIQNTILLKPRVWRALPNGLFRTDNYFYPINYPIFKCMGVDAPLSVTVTYTRLFCSMNIPTRDQEPPFTICNEDRKVVCMRPYRKATSFFITCDAQPETILLYFSNYASFLIAY